MCSVCVCISPCVTVVTVVSPMHRTEPSTRQLHVLCYTNECVFYGLNRISVNILCQVQANQDTWTRFTVFSDQQKLLSVWGFDRNYLNN